MDEVDPAAITQELPLLPAVPDHAVRPVVTGRARPVVLTDAEIALLAEDDDRSAHLRPLAVGERWREPRDGSDGTLGVGDRSVSDRSWMALVGTAAALAIVAILIVAFGLALAAR
jgi:hypothetical protein